MQWGKVVNKMELPGFEEFKNSLSEEKIADMFGRSMLNIYQMENFTSENASAFLSKVAFDIMAKSAEYSLNLLQAYHEWLQTQL